MVGNWITSYLTDRSQFIHVGSESSDVTDCSCGVPQGSVLGPLFCVAYISPVACIASKFGVFLSQYADNTQLYVALSKKAVNDAKLSVRGSNVV
jgi:Reverse transcriptase (RNA-dependent DNA polymerase)